MGAEGAAAVVCASHPTLAALATSSSLSRTSPPLWRTGIAATLQTERTNFNGIFVSTVRPLAAMASSRSSSSTTATTPYSYTAPYCGQRYKLGPIGPTTINDSMGAEGAAAVVCTSHPTIAAASPPPLSFSRSNGIFVNTVRPLAAAASSRPSSSTTATTPYCYTAPNRGQRYKLGPIGPTTKNDSDGCGEAATTMSASPLCFHAPSRAV